MIKAVKGFFAPLAVKILTGVAVALLVTVAILSWLLSNANGTIETQRTEIARLNAEAAVQNAAIARAGQESERQRQAFSEAVESGNAAIREAQTRVVTVRRTERNGCPTPPQIMGAGL